MWVRTRGLDQHGDCVLELARWVMVRKRDEKAAAPGEHVPRLPTSLDVNLLGDACPPIRRQRL